MSDEATVYAAKMRRAAQVLFLSRYRVPGVKGWELRRLLGRDYLKVIELLNSQLERMGLRVKSIKDAGEDETQLDEESTDRSRFYVAVEGPLTLSEMGTAGWRVDELAVLAVAVAYVSSRQGKAPRKEIEDILKQKMSTWRIQQSLDRLIRQGYLLEDENNILHLGWRTRAEVDLPTLSTLLISSEGTPTVSEGQKPSIEDVSNGN